MPPIFQPELIAAGIIWAADHPDRHELILGWPALKAIWGEKVAPGIADRVLASTGYDSQQTDEPENPDRPHNLWEPVLEDRGARGAFSDRARDFSAHIWATTHRGTVAAAVGAATVAVLAGALALRRS